MTFPDMPLDLSVQAAFGADLTNPGSWAYTDVTPDVRAGLVVRRGRQDEGQGRPGSSGCVFELDNPGGIYTPYHPLSAHYPGVLPDTPASASIGSPTTPAVRSVSSATALGTSVTVTKPTGTTAGDLLVAFHSCNRDIREMTTPGGGTWTLLASENSSLTTNDALRSNVWWRLATDSEPASYTFGQGAGANGVAAIVAVTGGVSAIAASQREDDPGSTFDTPSVLPISTDDMELRWVAGTSDIGVTWTPPAGFTEQVDAQSGGATAASLATRSLASGAATGVHTFTSSTSTMEWGHGFTVLVSSATARAVMSVAQWLPGFADGGGGPWEDAPVCGVDAAGVLRRLDQGAPPLRSAIRRAYEAAGVRAHWPLEDGSGATRFGSAVSGHPPAMLVGTGTLSSEDTLAASAALPSVTGPSSITAPIPSVGITDEWQVEFFIRVETEPAAQERVAVLETTGTVARWVLYLRNTAGQMRVEGYDADGVLVSNSTSSTASTDFYGNWVHFGFRARQVSSDVSWGFNHATVQPGDPTIFTGSVPANFAGMIGRPTSLTLGFIDGTDTAAFGHIAVFGFARKFGHWYSDNGRVGEPAGARFVRLCQEHDIPYRVVGDPYDSEPMGPQRIATLVDLLVDIETTDGGMLYEIRDAPGLTYRTRASRYNAPVALALQKVHLAPSFRPTADDQTVRNDIEVGRRDGSSARFEDLAHIARHGRKAESVTGDVADEARLADHALWRGHLGTVEEIRYPRITLYLHADPDLIPAWLACDIGSRVTIAQAPASLPPGEIDLIIDGYVETLDALEWTVELVCSPASPWQVAAYDISHYDTAGSQLNGAHDSSTPSLSVETTLGPVWTTTDEPFDIVVGGERMTVTVVTGSTSPQTFTVTRAVNGVVKAHADNAPVRLWQPPVYAL